MLIQKQRQVVHVQVNIAQITVTLKAENSLISLKQQAKHVIKSTPT